MGDIVVTVLKVLAALSVLLLVAGGATKSRSMLILGASIGASVVLTWVLGLLGLPIGIFFGFLSFGGLFASRSKKSED